MQSEHDHLEVGSVKDTTEHFIAVSAHRSEPLAKCFSGDKMVAIRFEREDIPWLIDALQHELVKADLCEHAVPCGDWCEACNRAYRAYREADEQAHL